VIVIALDGESSCYKFPELEFLILTHPSACSAPNVSLAFRADWLSASHCAATRHRRASVLIAGSSMWRSGMTNFYRMDRHPACRLASQPPGFGGEEANASAASVADKSLAKPPCLR